jgi:hypothetical protein
MPLSELILQHTENPYFRPWVCDANADGNDDLLIVHGGKLQALNPWQKLRPLWEWPLPPGYSRAILELWPGTGKAPATIVVGCGASLYGVSAGDGSALWSIAGPRPLNASGNEQWITRIVPQGHNQAGAPPLAAFQRADQFVSLRQGVLRQGGTAQQPDAAKQSAAAAVNLPGKPRFQTGRRLEADPRVVRLPSWTAGEGQRLDAAKSIGWGVALSLFLIVLPGWVLARTIERGQSGWGTLLKFAALALLMLAVLRIPGPRQMEPPGLSAMRARLVGALVSVPAPAVVLVVANLAARKKWRSLLACVGLAILFFACVTAYGVVHDRLDLDVDERYVLTGWDVLIARACYAVGCILAPIAGVMTFARAMRARRKAASPAIPRPSGA